MQKIARKSTYRSFFSISPIYKTALASSMGLFFGSMPATGISYIILLLLVLLLKLNIFALIVGFSAALVIPIDKIVILGIDPQVDLEENFKVSLLFASFSYLIFVICYKCIINKRKRFNDKNFIFCDTYKLRWRYVKYFCAFTISAALIINLFFLASININPQMKGLDLNGLEKRVQLDLNISEETIPPSSPSVEVNTPQNTYKVVKGKEHVIIGEDAIKKSNIFAYYDSSDKNGLISLENNIDKIDYIIPDWFYISDTGDIENRTDISVDNMAKEEEIEIIPSIRNYTRNTVNISAVHNILVSSELRSGFVQKLLQQIQAGGYSGLNIDFAELEETDRYFFTQFMTELYTMFRANNLTVILSIRPDECSYDYSKLSEHMDYGVFHLVDPFYFENTESTAHMVNWKENYFSKLTIPKEKIIIGLGSCGFDIISSGNGSKSTGLMSFTDVMETANESRLKINWNSTYKMPYVKYSERDWTHTVWLMDGVVFYNQLKEAAGQGIYNAALWRLGSEDSSVWGVIKNFRDGKIDNSLFGLRQITPPVWISNYGEGQILNVTRNEKDSKRKFEVDKSNFITFEEYEGYPVSNKVNWYGKPQDKKIVLTFDDGPDPAYTPKILDILKQYGIKASFFILGKNAVVNPDLVKRIYNDGHEIGNHTFFHSDISDIPQFLARYELNATQRLIGVLTGHYTTLYRPPYMNYGRIEDSDDFNKIAKIQDMGYTMVSQDIDTLDWQVKSVDEIKEKVMAQLATGSIILLHDAGGERSKTVEALPGLIDTLKERGYTFTTISDLMGKDGKDVMPPVDGSESYYMRYGEIVFNAIKNIQYLGSRFFVLAIILGILRYIMLIILSAKQRLSNKTNMLPAYTPLVSVIIPAYNEEKVICKTILSALCSDYPKVEIVVVNDGSSDNTAYIVKDNFRNLKKVRLSIKTSEIKKPLPDNDVYDMVYTGTSKNLIEDKLKTTRELKLISKDNGGKSSAINKGIKDCSGEIVVIIDADTIIAEDAISLMVKHFVDEKVAAVSGNVKVGNINNTLTLWQHIEYISGFNLERRAYHILNCITVVPGAIGAWRKSAIIEAGYFNDETLAEDTDITLTFLKNGCKVRYEANAFAYTESPANIKSFLKQRFRWSFGVLQCLWKHRSQLFKSPNKALGLIALPSMWLFQFVLQTMYPISSIYFIMGMFGSERMKLLASMGIYFSLDFFTSLYAFFLGKEDSKPLIWLPLQRFIYKILMTYIDYKSIIAALKGKDVGWNKLNRTGDVADPVTEGNPELIAAPQASANKWGVV